MTPWRSNNPSLPEGVWSGWLCTYFRPHGATLPLPSLPFLLPLLLALTFLLFYLSISVCFTLAPLVVAHHFPSLFCFALDPTCHVNFLLLLPFLHFFFLHWFFSSSPVPPYPSSLTQALPSLPCSMFLFSGLDSSLPGTQTEGDLIYLQRVERRKGDDHVCKIYLYLFFHAHAIHKRSFLFPEWLHGIITSFASSTTKRNSTAYKKSSIVNLTTSFQHYTIKEFAV